MYPYDPNTPQNGPPSKKHHWYRPRNVTVSTGALLVALVVVGCGGDAAKTPPVAPTATHSTSAPAATETPEPVFSTDTSPNVEDWMLGGGYTAMKTVQSDIQTVSSDAGARDLPAVVADGPALAVDARSAAALPPPIGTADYAAAMNQFAAAGDAMAASEITVATAHLNAGTVLLGKVSAALKSAASLPA